MMKLRDAARSWKYQSPERWKPKNYAFVNCYDWSQRICRISFGPADISWNLDQSLEASVLELLESFEFGRSSPRDGNPENDKTKESLRADAEGQIAIDLPHNSLRVMQAGMQDEWKVRGCL